jgi:hypothetical protein
MDNEAAPMRNMAKNLNDIATMIHKQAVTEEAESTKLKGEAQSEKMKLAKHLFHVAHVYQTCSLHLLHEAHLIAELH